MVRKFRIWAFSCSHLTRDIRRRRESLAEAIRHSEQHFEWDIAIDLGDHCGSQHPPTHEEGQEVVRQFSVVSKHAREAIYSLCGNHDRSAADEPAAWWWRTYVDPLGEHTSISGVNQKHRPFPIVGTWERYEVNIGNIRLLVMSDVLRPNSGRRGDLGGDPGGVIRSETLNWWRERARSTDDTIIISAHHYLPRNTTVATGDYEGVRADDECGWKANYNGPGLDPRGSSHLYYVDDDANPDCITETVQNSDCAIWLGGHTHTNPDDTYGEKSHIETKWGCHFINCAALTKYMVKAKTVPMSRLLTFEDGSDQVCVQCFLHTSDYAPKDFYQRVERWLQLPTAFRTPDSRQ